MANKAIGRVAELNNAPIERLAIANSAWLGNEIYRVKVLDTGTGAIFVVNLLSSGELATDQEVTSLLQASLEKSFTGKIETRLKEKADQDSVGTSTVCVWVKTPEVPRQRWRLMLEAENTGEVFSEAREFHRQAERPVIQFLQVRAIKVKYADDYVPIVVAEIPNAMLEELAQLPQVGRIFDNPAGIPALAVSIPTIKAQRVWNAGFTGANVKVAVVELPFQGSSAVSGNPNLIAASFYDPNSTTPGAHAVGVAGVICSTEPVYKGVSHGVMPGNLLSGNATTVFADEANRATSWAAGQGANVINQSYGDQSPTGQLNDFSKYDDYIVSNYFPTIAVSAGNNPPSLVVANPAIAYNVIGVGEFATGGTPDWVNDFMAPTSAFINPQSAHGDREKPDVAAPGGVISLSETFDPISGWLKSWSGTSFAAPHVSGTAILLMSKKPSLKIYPETIKAIVMASAIHNIEGNSRLSDKDGAGGIQAKAAYDIVANGWHSASFVSNGCADLSNAPALFATAGQLVRVVISWLVPIDANLTNYTFADADLSVSSPNHSQTWTSTSFDNNFEIVEFTAPQTGVYSVQACYKAGQSNPIQLMGYAYYIQ
ncbi:MAG TPA: S8 family serine peptidase [Blastocatellia bacterium]|nr:S8 family serine peptidase [Blastocatellia bacterium]